MSNTHLLIESIKQNSGLLIENYEKQKKELAKLKQQIDVLKTENNKCESLVSELKSENELLKVSNGISGDNTHKREVKYKINELVREIDQCMALLNQ